jgi:DNA polymerase III alpha subunit
MSQFYEFPCGCRWPIVGPPPTPGAMPLIDINLRKLPWCNATWDLLGRGDTKGVFQLESNLGRTWSKKLKPTSAEHMSALCSLLRPGCLQCFSDDGVSMTERYVLRASGREPTESIHPEVDPFLSKTYNVITYQEQIMRLGVRVAGFDLIQKDRIRKAVGKKDQKELAEVGHIFIEGVKKQGLIPVELGATLWEWIKASGRYLFNKSHAACYGVVGYRSAYLKSHIPVGFFVSWLGMAGEDGDPLQEIYELVNDAKIRNIDVLTPDLRSLEKYVSSDGIQVYMGMSDVKGLGEKQVGVLKESIEQEERVLGKPISKWTWYEFLIRSSNIGNTSAVNRLIQVGAMRCFNMPRKLMMAEFSTWNELTDKEKEWILGQQPGFTNLVDAMKTLSLPKYVKPKRKKDPEPVGPFGGCHSDKRQQVVRSLVSMLEKPPTPLQDTPLWLSYIEEELLGVSITCSKVESCDLGDVNTTIKEFIDGKTGYLVLGVEVRDVREVKVKRGKQSGQKMCFLAISDASGQVDNVTVFADGYTAHKHLFTPGNTILIQGERDEKRDSLIVKKAFQL